VSELRRFLRLAKPYRVEYGLFPLSGRDGEIRSSVLKNISGGGLLFHSPDPFPLGRQILLKIQLTGWREHGDELIESENENETVILTAIAEVKWSEPDPEASGFAIGVEFLGRILS